MRVFVTGASGAIGSRLVPQLIDAGHEVVGTHHSPASAELLRTLGAKPVGSICSTRVRCATPCSRRSPRRSFTRRPRWRTSSSAATWTRWSRTTNELRTKGTDALLAAAREAGVRRFVAQSVAAFSRYAREGGPVKTEDDPLEPAPPASFRQSAAALDHLEQAVTELRRDRLALRRLLRRRQRRLDRAGPQAAVPDRRRRRRHLVLDPPRRRRRRNRSRAGARRARRSTTSSTTSRRRCANGCRCSPRPSARSRHGTCRPGSRGCSPASSWSCCPPRRAVPRTRRRSASSAGRRAIRAGGRGSRPPTRRFSVADRPEPRPAARASHSHG